MKTILLTLTLISCCYTQHIGTSAWSHAHLLTNSVSEKAAEKWCEPLSRPLQIVRSFERPAHRYAPGHRGIDIRGETNVYAPAAGTVTFVGKVVDRSTVTVGLDNGLMYSIEPVLSTHQVGDRIKRCQLLGTIEKPGHIGGNSVHLGVRKNGEYLNPARFFYQKPRLLPLKN